MRPRPAGLRLGWSNTSEQCAARSRPASLPTPASFTPLTRVRRHKDDGLRLPSRTGEPCIRSSSSGASQPLWNVVLPGQHSRMFNLQRRATLGPRTCEHCARCCGATPGTVAQCWFAVWEGWGELHGGNTVRAAADGGSPPRPRQAPARWQLDLRAARFALPGRDYYLFTGPLDDALRIGTWITEDWFSPGRPTSGGQMTEPGASRARSISTQPSLPARPS